MFTFPAVKGAVRNLIFLYLSCSSEKKFNAKTLILLAFPNKQYFDGPLEKKHKFQICLRGNKYSLRSLNFISWLLISFDDQQKISVKMLLGEN